MNCKISNYHKITEWPNRTIHVCFAFNRWRMIAITSICQIAFNEKSKLILFGLEIWFHSYRSTIYPVLTMTIVKAVSMTFFSISGYMSSVKFPGRKKGLTRKSPKLPTHTFIFWWLCVFTSWKILGMESASNDNFADYLYCLKIRNTNPKIRY